jgi:transcriptional regulator with XRE-family HTH domain
LELITNKGITNYRVSKDTGIPYSTLSDWKRGISVPKVDKLQRIADYLGVSLGGLM